VAGSADGDHRLVASSPAHLTDPSAERSPPVLRELIHHPEHGPIPALLLGLTVVTGIVDAVSILSLGRVFVANMTGNVVFIGFALARAPGFSLSASLSALAGFLLGALLAGRLIRAIVDHRRLFATGTALEVALLALALTDLLAHHDGTGGLTALVVAGVLAAALGLQNGVVRRLGVPDLTTTVLTMTLTGLAADRSTRNATARRLLALLSMLAGAAVGAVLVLTGGPQWAVLLALVLAGAVAGAAQLAASSRP
jgi:uncharacterized membrane protein YoaK (UPF0700 family)